VDLEEAKKRAEDVHEKTEKALTISVCCGLVCFCALTQCERQSSLQREKTILEGQLQALRQEVATQKHALDDAHIKIRQNEADLTEKARILDTLRTRFALSL